MLRCTWITVTMTGMAVIFRRPPTAVRLKVAPQLASWDKEGTPSQLRLAGFLAHVAEVAGPVVAAASGRVAVELTVGLPGHQPLIDGGRHYPRHIWLVRELPKGPTGKILHREVQLPQDLLP